jgi:hypothetical protein
VCAIAAFSAAAFAAFCIVRTRCGVALPVYEDVAAPEPEIKPVALGEDELSALCWLEFVTGKLSQAQEREWWDSASVRQFGLFAKRYNIAFAGYAAAALGMRGNGAERATVGRILSNCIERMLRRDVWAYSQAKNYWGVKPWAPDPCYRENVMYTGHLLQLMAFYECFTGDRRYWEKGFDFVWKDGRIVHYDVKRLIAVIVDQMRTNPSGGITCEPDLLFFPCNNHPHIALSLFSKLGHGNWTTDARRWEQWAVKRFFKPVFGGGALNIVQHVKSGIMYPRGHNDSMRGHFCGTNLGRRTVAWRFRFGGNVSKGWTGKCWSRKLISVSDSLRAWIQRMCLLSRAYRFSPPPHALAMTNQPPGGLSVSQTVRSFARMACSTLT